MNTSHPVIWAIAILVGTVAAMFGYAVTDAEQQTLVEAGSLIAGAFGTIFSAIKVIRDRKAPPPAVVLLLVLPLVGLAGCQGREIRVAQQTFKATLSKVNDAREAQQINDETWTNVVVPAREATAALLQQVVDDYLASKEFDWRAALVRVYDAMRPLLRQRELLEDQQ